MKKKKMVRFLKYKSRFYVIEKNIIFVKNKNKNISNQKVNGLFEEQTISSKVRFDETAIIFFYYISNSSKGFRYI